MLPSPSRGEACQMADQEPTSLQPNATGTTMAARGRSITA
jgi:hypothetical protein